MLYVLFVIAYSANFLQQQYVIVTLLTSIYVVQPLYKLYPKIFD